MISKAVAEHLEELRALAVDGTIMLRPNEIAERLYLSNSYTRNVLYLLQANGKLALIMQKGRILGVRLYDDG